MTLFASAHNLRIPAPRQIEFARLNYMFALMVAQRKAEPFKSRKIYFAE